MASVTNPVQSPVRTSRFSSLYLSLIRVSPSVVALKSRSSVASRALWGGSLAFSPLPEKVKAYKNKSSVESFSDKVLGFSAWNQRLRRRDCLAEFPVVKAAAADAEGRDEIEVSDGFGLSSSFFAFFFFFWKFSLMISDNTCLVAEKVWKVETAD